MSHDGNELLKELKADLIEQIKDSKEYTKYYQVKLSDIMSKSRLYRWVLWGLIVKTEKNLESEIRLQRELYSRLSHITQEE